GLPSAPDRGEVALEARDALADEPPVGLELRLTGSPRADPARLPFEMLPHAGEPRQRILELRELDLEPRLARARAPREDVEDELGAVHDLDAERLLEIADLRGRQVVVEDRHVRVELVHALAHLLELALADEGRGMDVA